MGAWDEHIKLQKLLNDFVVNNDKKWINNDLSTFLSGYLQHQLYDNLVEEKPINVSNIGNEVPSVILNLAGVYKNIKTDYDKYKETGDKDKWHRKLWGYLGSVTPDVLEALRLLNMPDGKKSWNNGDSQVYHWDLGINPLIDTRDNPQSDLERRIGLQLIDIDF